MDATQTLIIPGYDCVFTPKQIIYMIQAYFFITFYKEYVHQVLKAGNVTEMEKLYLAGHKFVSEDYPILFESCKLPPLIWMTSHSIYPKLNKTKIANLISLHGSSVIQWISQAVRGQ